MPVATLFVTLRNSFARCLLPSSTYITAQTGQVFLASNSAIRSKSIYLSTFAKNPAHLCDRPRTSKQPYLSSTYSLDYNLITMSRRVERPRTMDCVGNDTFRGTAMNSTGSRLSLYGKNDGHVALDNTGVVLRVESPISGDLLVTPVARNKNSVRDPMTGTPMRYKGDSAIIKTPAAANGFMRTRKFYIDKDIDITIQTLRGTTKVNKYTNEKVGTAGTPTGMDPALLFYQGRR